MTSSRFLPNHSMARFNQNATSKEQNRRFAKNLFIDTQPTSNKADGSGT